MEFLNTANPIVILFYTIIISIMIIVGKKTENPIFSALLMAYIVILLIFHTTMKTTTDALIRTKYISIAFDMIFLFLSFISYLWIDDIYAKKKNLKSYDNSLSWFWDEL